MNEKMQLLSRGLILFYSIACLFLLLTGAWLFPFVFGPTFNKMYLPFILLTPAILCYSVIHLLAAYYSGKKVLRVNLAGNILALTVIVIGDWLVIPNYGIAGAAVVSSAGYVCYMSYMLLAHAKEYNSRFVDFLLFRKSDARMLLGLLKEKLSPAKNNEA